MLTVLVWNSVRLISLSHAEVLQHNVNEKALLLANLLAPGLAVDDRAILLDNLFLVGKEKNILYAIVEDIEGNVKARSGKIPDNVSPHDNYEEARKAGIFNVEKPISLSGQKLGQLKLGYSIKYVEALIGKTRFQNTSIASIELVLSLLMTMAIGYLLTRSLRRLEQGTRALARGELEHRIDLDSKDEMGDLARAFNRLAKNLSKTREELFAEHQTLEKQRSQMQTLIDGVDAVIVEIDPEDYRLLYVSREAKNLLGYDIEEWTSTGFLLQYMHADDRQYFELEWKKYLQSPGTYTIDFRMLNNLGHYVDIRSIITFDHKESGKLTCRGLLLNITEQKRSEERVVYLANHDVLTGLFNRQRFQEELDRELEYAIRYNKQGALLFIDLDEFKYINDTLGHQAGDEHLCAIARCLTGGLRKVDILGRLGGDEFGIILTNTTEEQVHSIASQLLRKLSEANTTFNDIDTPVSASMGIVIFPDHGKVQGNLLALADVAMYSAKEKGRNTYHLHSEGDTQIKSMHAKMEWEYRIREALEKDLFVLHYQPIYWLNNRNISHYEVLLRMQDDDGSLVPPGEFLGIAERFGMIKDIDKWVLERAIKVQGESCRNKHPVSLAINLSGKHIGNPDMLSWIQQFIAENGADPSMLIFEITETAAVENISNAARFVESLHVLGCKIALDDFGIGYSSFQYLKHLPVDMVKLDGSFVSNVNKSKFDRVFIRSMTDMARGLGITSVAEFIESEDIVDTLKNLDVDMGQGFHLARPAAHFLELNNVDYESNLNVNR